MIHKRVARGSFLEQKTKTCKTGGPKGFFFEKKEPKRPPKVIHWKKNKMTKKGPKKSFFKKNQKDFFFSKKRLLRRKNAVPSKSGSGLGRDQGRDWVGIGSGLGRDWVGGSGDVGRDWVKMLQWPRKIVILFFFRWKKQPKHSNQSKKMQNHSKTPKFCCFREKKKTKPRQNTQILFFFGEKKNQNAKPRQDTILLFPVKKRQTPKFCCFREKRTKTLKSE